MKMETGAESANPVGDVRFYEREALPSKPGRKSITASTRRVTWRLLQFISALPQRIWLWMKSGNCCGSGTNPT